MERFTRRGALKGIMALAGVTVLGACAPAPTPVAVSTTAPAAVKPTEIPKATEAAKATTAPSTAPAAAPTTAATAQPAASTGAKSKVVYWGSFAANLGEAEQEVVKRFNASQQAVEVDYQFQGSYEQTAQKLTAALQAKTAPEITILSDVWWFKFYSNKTLAPLDDFMKANNVDRADFVDPLINEYVRKGQQYALPFARSTPIFYYNRNVWKEAGLPDRGPDTWDEFKTWVPKLLKKDSSGKVTQYAFAHPGAGSYIAWAFQGIIWQFGGVYSDPDFKIRIAEPAGVQAAEFLRSTVTEGWSSTPQNIDNDFRGGIAVAMMGSTAGIAGHEKAAKFEVGTSFLPKGPKGFSCPTGGSGLAILAGAPKDKQEAAFKYLAFATSVDTTSYWSQNTGYMPVRKSAIQGPMQAFYKEKANFLTSVKQLELTKPQDSARVFIPNGDQIIGKGLERITINKEPVEPALKDIAATLEKEAQPVIKLVKDLEG